MKLQIDEIITEGHFCDTFIFPDDLDVLGKTIDNQHDVDEFNGMIQSRQNKKGSDSEYS